MHSWRLQVVTAMTAFHQKEARQREAASNLPAPYPTAPPPDESVVMMSARAQKKFEQLDIDSSGYACVSLHAVFVCATYCFLAGLERMSSGLHTHVCVRLFPSSPLIPSPSLARLCIHPYLCLCLCAYPRACAPVPALVPACPSDSPPHPPPTHPLVCLSNRQCFCECAQLAACPPVCVSVCPPVRPFDHAHL